MKTSLKHKAARRKISAALTELTYAHGAPNTFEWGDLSATGYLQGMTRAEHASTGRKISEGAAGCAACGKGGDPLHLTLGKYGRVAFNYSGGAWEVWTVRPRR